MPDATALAPAAPGALAPTRQTRSRFDVEFDVALDRHAAPFAIPSIDLFRSPAFCRLHAGSFRAAWYARVVDRDSGDTCGGGWFAESEPGVARSGARGPYGGIFVPASAVTAPDLDAIVHATDTALAALGTTNVQITLPPAAHAPELQAKWMEAYERRGYRVLAPDLNFHASVEHVSLPERMNSGNRAVVRTAERKGMEARELVASERARAYAVNVENRMRRNRPVTMTFDALLAMDAALPGVLHWFGVFAGDRMIAASICIRISPSILYVFYLGDVDGVGKMSPVTLLVAHVHEWCRAQGIALLDLGIATERGVPNEGLMAYKRNLGFDVSPRHTLTKRLVA